MMNAAIIDSDISVKFVCLEAMRVCDLKTKTEAHWHTHPCGSLTAGGLAQLSLSQVFEGQTNA